MTDYIMPPVDDRLIWDIWLSRHHLPAMSVADELGVFPALAAAPLDTGALADALRVQPRALSIHLGLLAALGLVERRQGRWEATTPARTYLLPDSPFYWGALMSGARGAEAHNELKAALKPGEGPDPTKGHSVESWESGELGSEQARGIAAFMHAHSLPAAIGAARSGRFEGVDRLLDIGGGSGCYAIAAAQAVPSLRATIMELPAMCEVAADYIDEGGVQDRVDTISVDMFREDWPTGRDALFFSNIYHDWNEETCRELSAKAFAALPSGGRIFLHEQLMNDNLDGPVTTASFSMLMLLGTRGKQYSLPEFVQILGAAGFTAVRSTPTCGYYSLVEAVKP